MHTFCCFYSNPNFSIQKFYHEDFGIALIFGWFGDVFLSMSVQNSAILADPILTFYKVGIVGS